MAWRHIGTRSALWISVTLFFVVALLLFSRRDAILALKTAEKLHPLPDESYFAPTRELCDAGANDADFCASFPTELLDRVQITIKTGIGERERLEAVLATYGSCISNLLIVSDVEDVYDGHQIHDILSDLPTSYGVNNADWEVYEEQRQALADGDHAHKSAAGWKLDKYKFLPMVEYAYAKTPSADWYVFIEADTYFFWDTLFRILEKLDPNERHYLGSSVVGAYDRWFAYGGSGFILSKGLLRDLPLAGDERLSVKYEQMARPECCGDALLAYVLHAELKARLGNMSPSFTGDEPEWALVSKEHFCTPVLSLHHVSAERMAEIWHWERCRRPEKPTQPITFATLLDWTLTPPLANGNDVKAHWDNGAGRVQKKKSPGHQSAEACFESCWDSDKCVQASYSEHTCRFSELVRAGHAVDSETESFWDLGKLERMGWHPDVDSSASCSTIKWITPKIMRPH